MGSDPRKFLRRAFLVALVAVLCLGFVLRSAQYFAAASMWYDELAVARNFDSRSFGELISSPLDHGQVAPAGFLVAVKAATVLLGTEELGLRLVPWLCAIAAMILFWRVAQRFVSGPPLLCGLALFSVSPALVWYAGVLKQYSGDVTVTLLLVWLALVHMENPRHLGRAMASGAIGGVALLVSHPAVPTAALLCVLLAVRWLRERPKLSLGPLAALGTGWGLGALVAASSALMLLDPRTEVAMDSYWSDGFAPASWVGVDALSWLPQRLFDVFAYFLLLDVPSHRLLQLVVVVPLAFALLGLPFLFRRSSWQAAMLLAPVVAGVLAAGFHLLPLSGRVALYTGGPILLFSTGGVRALGEWLPGWSGRVAVGLAVAAGSALAVGILYQFRPPFRNEETRPVLAELATRFQSGDVLYVYRGARHAMNFYGPRLGFEKWQQARAVRGDIRAQFRELDEFRGRRRVWLFYTHSPRTHREAAAIRSYLDAVGVETDRIADFFGNQGVKRAAAHLYDLSDPARLASTTAEEHPLPAKGRR